jgi:hypothetical protein
MSGRANGRNGSFSVVMPGLSPGRPKEGLRPLGAKEGLRPLGGE